MQGLLLELKGPHYGLASAEVYSVLEALEHEYRTVDSCPDVLHIETTAEPDMIGKKLGLTHRIYYHLKTAEEDELIQGKTGIRLPPGTASVSTRRIQGRKARSQEINVGLGRELAENNTIDLDSPDHRTVVMVSDRYFVGLLAYDIDKKPFQKRLSRHRPFFSPVSLEPNLARVLVNLAKPGKNASVHDPFCGTGGILLEAADMGFVVSGGDIDEKMVSGCKENLEFYGLDASIVRGDVFETTPNGIDRIITDPPYGRSSSSQGENVSNIYDRLFRTAAECLTDGGYLSVIFPDSSYYEKGSKILEPIEMHRVYVHNTLERFFCVFKKR